jgi:(p)ppGpp synthase/HD superfamily hydrolase
MATLEKAIETAAKAHAGQLDKAGNPYVEHPLRMMLKMQTIEEKIVAVLHDVVEDSDTTLDDLRREGFSEKVLDAVDVLTRKSAAIEDYDAYLSALAANPIARKVKLADLEDNMNLVRLLTVTEKDLQRLQKYHSSWTFLRSAK